MGSGFWAYIRRMRFVRVKNNYRTSVNQRQNKVVHVFTILGKKKNEKNWITHVRYLLSGSTIKN